MTRVGWVKHLLPRRPAKEVNVNPQHYEAIGRRHADMAVTNMTNIMMGPRVPGVASSQKAFRLGFVFLTQQGVSPSAADLAAVDALRQHFNARFFGLTRGVAVADTSIRPPTPLSQAEQPDTDRALAWLEGSQQTDGRFEESSGAAIRDTSAVIETLARFNRIGLGFARAFSWLSNATPREFDSTARRAVGLAAGGAPPAQRADLRAALLAKRNADGGFGLGPGLETDALDTGLALRALKANGSPGSSLIAVAVNALAPLRDMGAWPAAPAAPRSAAVTSEVLLALQDWPEISQGQVLMGDALTALLNLQNADGGFGEDGSTVYATALALRALGLTAAPLEVTSAATTWLARAQSSDGSWSHSPYETALALIALRSGRNPNLIVPAQTMIIEPAQPTEGVPMRLSFVIRNAGQLASAATVARITVGAPPQGALVGEVSVPALAAGEEVALAIDVPTENRAGSRSIYVEADPLNSVRESREDDNTSSLAVFINGLLPDLVIDPLAGALSSNPPLPGELVSIQVRVRNQGDKASAAVDLSVVSTEPGGAVSLAGVAPVPALDPGAWADLTVSWTNSGVIGVWTLKATVDSAFALVERDDTNNDQILLVSVEDAPLAAEFEIASITSSLTSLQTLPATARISVTVGNRGRQSAPVRLILFDGGAPDTLLGDTVVNPGPRSSETRTFDLTFATPETRVLVARVDPGDLIVEDREDNNQGVVTIPSARDTWDFTFAGPPTAPASVGAGEIFTVSFEGVNRGTADAPLVQVSLLADQNDTAAELGTATNDL